MKIKRFIWRWDKSYEELDDAKSKLEEVKADDMKLKKLEKRIDKIMRENNLAPVIIRALGVRSESL